MPPTDLRLVRLLRTTPTRQRTTLLKSAMGSHSTYPPTSSTDPSRLGPGTLNRAPTDASFSSTTSRSSWTGGPGSKRKLLAGKALDLSSKVLSKSAEYLAKNEYDGMAASFTRAEGKVRSAKEARDWGEYDSFVSNRDMQVGGKRTPQPSPGLLPSSSSPDYFEHDKGKRKAGAGAAAAGASYLSYFGRQQREARNRQVFTEEHVVCFPGYAALRSPSHNQAGDIDIFLSGYCYRSRPADSAPTKSQRLLYAMTRKWTGLPSLPVVPSARPSDGRPGSAGLSSQDEMDESASVADEGELEAAMREKDLIDFDEANADREDAPKSPAEAKERTFAALLEMAEHEVAEEAENSGRAEAPRGRPRRFTSEPEEMESAVSAVSNANLSNTPSSSPAKPSKLNPAPTPPRPNGPSPSPPSSVSKFQSSQSSHRSTPYISSVTSSAGSSAVGVSKPLSRRNSFEGYDLAQLHHNLKDRLQGFFGQKMEGRRIAIEVWPTGSLSDSSSHHHHAFSVLSTQRPLLTRVVMTKSGGAWSEKLTLPWQTLEAFLKVRAGRLDRSPDTGVTRLKVRVELLRDESLMDKADKAWATALGAEGAQGTERGQERRIVEREVAVTPAAGAQGFHLVSDIDDTIKRTEVLGGMKSIFRNVFLWSFEQTIVPGMAEWYRDMFDQGVVVHYVSNSPWELWAPIEKYLAVGDFPPGSVSLKEYASIITNMWESAGARKRARIEALMQEFSTSRFIFVGDSGEADLEVYASLAQQYPGRVAAIYIRNVSTLPGEKRPESKSGTPTPSRRNSFDGTPPETPRGQKRSQAAGVQQMPGSIPAAKTGTKDFASQQPKRQAPMSFAPRDLPHSSSTSSLSSLSTNKDPYRDPSADALSPNNPTSTPSPEDARQKVVNVFWARVRKAEAEVPHGTVVRLFRTGDECRDEAMEIVEDESDQRSAGTPHQS